MAVHEGRELLFGHMKCLREAYSFLPAAGMNESSRVTAWETRRNEINTGTISH